MHRETSVSVLRPLRGLRIDLSRRSCCEEELPAEIPRAFLGGRGLGAYFGLKERLYDVEPLSPENLLIFAPGPLTGTGAPASGRYSVTSRSPLTGMVFDGNSGGNWGNAEVVAVGAEVIVASDREDAGNDGEQEHDGDDGEGPSRHPAADPHRAELLGSSV